MADNEWSESMYQTGDKPGKGVYECTICGEIVVIDNDDQELPVCPVCGGTVYEKRS